jgi:protein involved in ribonucleotide reduction
MESALSQNARAFVQNIKLKKYGTESERRKENQVEEFIPFLFTFILEYWSVTARVLQLEGNHGLYDT